MESSTLVVESFIYTKSGKIICVKDEKTAWERTRYFHTQLPKQTLLCVIANL